MDINKRYWEKFINSSDTNSIYCNRDHNFFSFGDDPNKLAKLVYSGVKTATSSLFDSYSYDKEDIPKPGLFSIILNSDNTPICIIEIKNVEIIQLKYITEDMARKEINEENALALWKKFHFDFFQKKQKI